MESTVVSIPLLESDVVAIQLLILAGRLGLMDGQGSLLPEVRFTTGNGAHIVPDVRN